MYPFPEVCGHGLRAGSAAGKPPVSGQQRWLRLHARTCPHSALESSKDFCPLLPPSPQGLLPSSSSVPPGPSQQQRAGKLAREEGRQPGLTAFIPQPDFCCKCYFTCPTALRSTWQLPFRHRENPSLFLSLLDSKLEFKFCTQVFLTLQFSLIPSQDQRKKSEKQREISGTGLRGHTRSPHSLTGSPPSFHQTTCAHPSTCRKGLSGASLQCWAHVLGEPKALQTVKENR